MVNSQVVKETIEALKIDTNIETVPNAVPIVDVTLKKVKQGIAKTNSITNATSGTIYTTPSDSDFYLTGANMTALRDATATSTLFAIAFTPADTNVSQNLLTLAGITLTAHGLVTAQTPLMNPIKVARGTNINITSTSNTANFKVTGQIYGFIDEIN